MTSITPLSGSTSFIKGLPEGWYDPTETIYECVKYLNPKWKNCTCRKFEHCKAFDKDS